MSLLVAGVLLWILIHLFPVLLVDARAKLVTSLGEKPYKAIFAILILASVAMMIFGWQAASPPTWLYAPLPELRFPAMFLVVLGFIFLSYTFFPKSRMRRFIKHPQLIGVHVWAFAHLLANGEHRSVVLFGGLFVWSLFSMIMLNRRDGRPAPPTEVMPVWKEILVPIVVIIICGQIVKYHQYLSGIALMPQG